MSPPCQFYNNGFMYIKLNYIIITLKSFKPQNPQIEVPYPPTNGGQQHLGTLVAFVGPSIT